MVVFVVRSLPPPSSSPSTIGESPTAKLEFSSSFVNRSGSTAEEEEQEEEAKEEPEEAGRLTSCFSEFLRRNDSVDWTEDDEVAAETRAELMGVGGGGREGAGSSGH